MLNQNLLWVKTISPGGRLIKEPTFLGVALLALALFVGFGLLVYLGSFL